MDDGAGVKIKIAPNSKESEMLVLGCMLTSVNSLNVAADILDDSDFYYTEHKIIFQVLKGAYRQDKPADIHLVCEELKRLGKLGAVGGVAYVTSIAQYAGTSAHIEEYSNLVRNKSVLRRMVNAAQTVEKNALEDPSDVYGCLDEAQQLFFQISQSANPQAGVLIGEILSGALSTSKQPYLKELEARQEHFLTKGPDDEGITGLATAFTDFDKIVNGLGNSNLMILAARPAMGKTAFALNIAENVCFREGVPVGVFSLEMTAEQLLHRVICSLSEVESDKIKTGALNGQEYQRIVATVNKLEKQTMVIDDQPGLKITDLRARARRMKESYGIGLLIIDYLQLLSGSNSNRNLDSRQNEISEISRMLKNLARELDIPIICLSQLSRKVEDRAGHRPMMSDLRESGCLAGDTIIRDATTGKAHTIKQLAEREEQTPLTVHAINEDRILGEHQMTKVFYSGKKVVYELKTRTGRTIKASGNHPFLKLEGWTALDQLNPGDKIGLPRKLCFNKAHPLMNDSEQILPGHLVGDGCILPKALQNLADSDVYWDEILSVTELGIEDVYDATVEGVHNFLANDIIVHNSIEQDADVVMFLLRREYYDPMDKPGMAELIIAKNRHGSIGNVNLTFRKELAKFVNYTPIEFKDNYDLNPSLGDALEPSYH